jgi:phosphoglycerate dehydrogenase-like enzyme
MKTFIAVRIYILEDLFLNCYDSKAVKEKVMRMKNILVHFEVEDDIIEDLVDRFRQKGKLFTMRDIGKDLRQVSPKIHILLTSNLTLGTNPNILEEMTSLELIQSVTVGVDRFPFHKIRNQVIVCSASGALSQAVAEHAFALILGLAKNLVSHIDTMRKGVFDRGVQSKTLHNKTIGIVGFGSIGKQVANIARGLGMRVLAINRSGRTEHEVAFIGTLADLDHALSESDVVVIALPLTRLTKDLIGPKELELMKEDAILVNAARAMIIKQGDLYNHLRDHPRFMAASDVWWKYPKNREGGVSYQDYPFHQLENFWMTPHVAAHIPSSMEKLFNVAVENIKRYLQGQDLVNVVRKQEYCNDG